jgi:hypothetical protein
MTMAWCGVLLSLGVLLLVNLITVGLLKLSDWLRTVARTLAARYMRLHGGLPEIWDTKDLLLTHFQRKVEPVSERQAGNV